MLEGLEEIRKQAILGSDYVAMLCIYTLRSIFDLGNPKFLKVDTLETKKSGSWLYSINFQGDTLNLNLVLKVLKACRLFPTSHRIRNTISINV